MKRTSLAVALSALAVARVDAGTAIPTDVTVEAVDLERSQGFPRHAQPFHFGGRQNGIWGALHVRGAMQPHSGWRTAETSATTVHIRVAFKRPVKIGTVIGANGWGVSTLKEEAAFPGDVHDEALWEAVPEVEGQSGLRVLPFPEVVTTRAVRFTKYRALKAGEKRSEQVNGVVFSSRRLHSYTPEATAFASSERAGSEKEREEHGVHNLVRDSLDRSRGWSAGRSEPITAENPAWLVLGWDRPRAIRYVGLLDAFARRVEIDVYTGPADVHPLTAPKEAWKRAAAGNPPVWWRPIYTDCYFDLGEAHTTTALRLRVVEPLTTENGDIAYHTKGKRNVAGLKGVMALADLGDAPVPARPRAVEELPPVEISVRMPFDGSATVAIDDAGGKRVRALDALVPLTKGRHTLRWDGLNDNGGLVPPGRYLVKTIFHEPISIRWQMTPHNARDIPWWKSPSWGGQAGAGSFLSDHATPRSVCVLGEKVFVGSEIAESGHSLVALDLDGKKLWGTKWLDTAGASELATDGESLFVAAHGGWIGDTVMIFRVDPKTYRHKRIVQFKIDAAAGRSGGVSGLAASPRGGARGGRVYASFLAPERSHLSSVLSASNLDTGSCLPPNMDNAQHGGPGSLGKLLRAGGVPAPHHGIVPEGGGDVRHARVAFKKSQPVGTIVLPACGAEFSALRPDAAHPGDVNDEAQWIGLPSASAGKVQVVTAPPRLATRALRLTWRHRGGGQFRPWCGGFQMIGRRFADVAGLAEVSAGSGEAGAGGSWRSAKRPESSPVGRSRPESLTLAWRDPQRVRGLAFVNPFMKEFDIEVREAGGAWRKAGTAKPPVWWRPGYHDAYHDFGKVLALTGLRLKAVGALTTENSDVHHYTGGKPLFVSLDGVAVLSPLGDDPRLPADTSQRIAVFDAEKGTLLREIPVPAPRGLAFDEAGKLFAVSGKRIVRVDTETGRTTPVIMTRLADPFDLAFGPSGKLYVTDGKPHQVKVFTAGGRYVRTIGKPGGRAVGRYDPTRMANPRGVDVDSRGQVWVAEADYQPKRVSRWRASDGKLLGEKMGPARYGGGGWLDPRDKTRFYYGGMEFALDWDAGTWGLRNILWRDMGLPSGAPERPVYVEGRRYLVTDPGHQYGPFACVALHRGDRLSPLAVAGRAGAWGLLRTEEYAAALGDLTGKGFIWVDGDGDGKPRPGEVELGPELKNAYFTSYIGDDLTLNYGEIMLPPAGFTRDGAPRYSFRNARRRPALPVKGVYSTALLPDGSLFGVTSPITLQRPDGTCMWTYPEKFLGVHASHRAPRQERRECQGSLLFLGHAEAGGDIGGLNAVISNFGYVSLFTDDGLLAARLFHDYRTGKPGWHTDRAVRGMEVGGFSLGGEHFYGSFTRAADGRYYVVAGHNHSSIAEVVGLETLTRGKRWLRVSGDDVSACEAYVRRKKLAAARAEAPKFVRAPVLRGFRADGNLGEWSAVPAVGLRDAGSARLAYDDGKLYVAFDVKDPTPLVNAGGEAKMLFKTGDSVDLQIGLDPAAKSGRAEPVAGDVRLLLTEAGGKRLGVLYRHRVPGTAAREAHLFSSPWRAVRVDAIDVLDDLAVGVARMGKGYVLEAAVPFARLGFKVAPGARLKVDLGVLLGDEKGEETRERIYWANPATAIISDIPSEIGLHPALWGTVEFVK